ncbi:MAG: nucleoside deaminase [Bacteroidetes bacterium]|nr:nucleoside deaminase [Bacteroidota bacterium]
MDEHLMQRALALAAENVAAGGGPFGTIVVKDGRLVGTGVNRVTAMHDPTAHAEVVAIRDACANLGTFQLDGCDLYTSCEPCPMCLGAIYWARPDRVFYAASRHDAASAGFDDALIYDEIGLEPSARRIPFVHAPVAGTLRPFEVWNANDAKTRY